MMEVFAIDCKTESLAAYLQIEDVVTVLFWETQGIEVTVTLTVFGMQVAHSECRVQRAKIALKVNVSIF